MKQITFLFIAFSLLLTYSSQIDAFSSFAWFTSKEKNPSEILKEIADKVKLANMEHLKLQEFNRVHGIYDEYENMRKIWHSIIKQKKEHLAYLQANKIKTSYRLYKMIATN